MYSTDSNQKNIVKSLRDCGYQVVDLAATGNAVCDLLIGAKHRTWILCEIKTTDGRFKRNQLEFLAVAKGYAGFATTFDEAFQLARDPALFALTGVQQNKIAALFGNLERRDLERREISGVDKNMSEKETKTTSSGGIGFFGLLCILFIGLKLTNCIDWSWWWVLSPVLIPLGIYLSVMMIFLLLYLGAAIWDSIEKKRRGW